MDAREYHERTKHSIDRLRASPHRLDWAIQPLPFKVYTEIEPVPLPRDWRTSRVSALDAIASAGAPNAPDRVPCLTDLARLMHFAAGVIRVKEYASGQKMHFRAAACTGALHHVDLYLVCGALPGVDAGVYHFGPHDFALRRLRPGDHRATVIAATGSEPAVAAAPAILVCASTFWRNAWKYRARTYRHCFWDNGTILANLLAVAAADNLPARLVMGFVDEAVNELLGLDPQREVALSVVALGCGSSATREPAPVAPKLSLATEPLSVREIDYPLIREAHQQSCLASAEDVRAWRGGVGGATRRAAAGERFHVRAPDDLPTESIDEVIRRRGSTRRFARVAISAGQLGTLLRCATRGVPADFLADSDGSPALSDLYLIVNAVDGLQPGAYAYHQRDSSLELLRPGEFRREAGHLGLGQQLPADASVNFYFLCHLDAVHERYGNRGYRSAQMEAAILAGKLYLAAYALRLGATGLTFFDDDVTAFFSPHAAGKNVMFLIAIGRPARRRE